MAKILVVDDDEMMRDSLAANLSRDGHEVIAANDGQAGVARPNIYPVPTLFDESDYEEEPLLFRAPGAPLTRPGNRSPVSIGQRASAWARRQGRGRGVGRSAGDGGADAALRGGRGSLHPDDSADLERVVVQLG